MNARARRRSSRRAGARLDGLYVCTAPSDRRASRRFARPATAASRSPACSCARPPTSASTSTRSTMVGDKPSDLVPGRTVGAARGAGAHRLRAGRVGVPARRASRSSRTTSPAICSTRSTGRCATGRRVSDAAPAAARDRRRLPRAATIVVVGDLIVDEYLFGKPARISREAPVLILRFTEREVLLGRRGQRRPQRARAGRPRAADRRRRPRRRRRRAAGAASTPPASPPTGSSPRTAARRR